MKEIKYTIEASIYDEKWTLYSHVDTNYNGIAKNFICEGTLEECELRMKQMKALDELAKQTQEFECTPETHSIPMQNQHGYCPNCGMDFDDGLIWDTGLEMYGSEEEADDYAKAYGATRTTGRWGKRIGIYDMERDMTTQWMCPECKHEWPR